MLGDKYFLWNSIPNLIWIFGLVYYLYIRKSIGAVLVAMFIYLSLHGGYAIFAAATGSGIDTLNALHYQSSDLGAKLVGTCFLVYCSVLLGLRMESPLESVKGSILFRRDIFLLVILFLASMVYGAISSPGITSGKLQTVFKESVFATCMWLGIVIFSIAISQGREYFIYCRKEWFYLLVILGVLMTISGFYEIVTGVVWAGTYYVTGYSYRTSGTLFNPNVLGFWCALIVALVSLVFHLGWISRRTTFVAMIVVICWLILSASRSGLVLSMVNLSVVSVILFLSKKPLQLHMLDRVWPLIAFILAFTVATLVIQSATPSPYVAINSLYANLQRFLQLPVDIFSIFMIKVFFPATQKLNPLLISLLEWLPKNGVTEKLANFFAAMLEYLAKSTETIARSNEGKKMMESVNGRISMEYTSDNSFMSIYTIGGPVSLVIWLWLWMVLFWAGIKKNITWPGIFSAHALGGLVFCFASGFFLRTPQLFPVWIFISMVLGVCLCWWSSAGVNPVTADSARLSSSNLAKAL